MIYDLRLQIEEQIHFSRKLPELLLVILSGLSEVLRDSIKSYVFWSSWWV
jgi:hypothetical protein